MFKIENKPLIFIAIIAIVLLGILFLLYFLFDTSSLNDNKVKNVKLGQDFILKLGQTAIINEYNISLAINEMHNVPCTYREGEYGIAPICGQAISFVVDINGDKYNRSGSEISRGNITRPYRVVMSESDYETYAKFYINKPEDSCKDYRKPAFYNRPQDETEDQCLRWVSLNYNNFASCLNIKNRMLYNVCIYDFAEKNNDYSYCQHMTFREKYCRGHDILEKNDITLCPLLSGPPYGGYYRTSESEEACYKKYATKKADGSYDTDICNKLEVPYRHECKVALDFTYHYFYSKDVKENSELCKTTDDEDFCLEDAGLCDLVKEPRNFCLFFKAVENKDIKLCSQIIEKKIGSKINCYRSVSNKMEGDKFLNPIICSVLTDQEEKTFCEKSITE
jgi:hypothetical protein